MGRAGRLREQIIIQTGAETNTKGVISRTWTTHLTVRARIIRMERGEMTDAEKTNTIDKITVTTRYLPGVTTSAHTPTTKMRISWNAQFWDIQAIRPDERRAYMEMDAEEIV